MVLKKNSIHIPLKTTILIWLSGSALSITPGQVGELIKLIASSLVDKPDEVEIQEVSGDSTTVYELRVAQEDLGKILGNQGKTAKAIRVLLGAAAAKEKRRAVLEIIE